MNLSRRSFLGGIIAAGVAPAIVRAGILMPVKVPFGLIKQNQWPWRELYAGVGGIDRTAHSWWRNREYVRSADLKPFSEAEIQAATRAAVEFYLQAPRFGLEIFVDGTA